MIVEILAYAVRAQTANFLIINAIMIMDICLLGCFFYAIECREGSTK